MNVEINVPILHSRHLSSGTAIEAAQAFRDSGVIDSVTLYDMLMFFVPPHLWSPEHVPMAAGLPDIDSAPDPYLILAQIAAAVPGIGLTTTSDAVRRGPAELAQTLLTLGGLTNSKVMVQMGAGEVKQCKPFGHKRSQGIGRLEDHVQIFRKFMASGDPINHEGKFWNMDRAYIGHERRSKPELWVLGGGPRLLAAAANYADGFCTEYPGVWNTPEQAADGISALKKQIAAAGRDPESFGFGIWWMCLVHEDPQVIADAKKNDYIKFLSATVGRFNGADWQRDGINPPLGTEWHYANNLLPANFTVAETQAIIDAATPEVTDAAWGQGTPQEIADSIRPWIDAGITWVQILDLLPLTLPAAEAAEGARRAIEIAAALKSD